VAPANSARRSMVIRFLLWLTDPGTVTPATMRHCRPRYHCKFGCVSTSRRWLQSRFRQEHPQSSARGSTSNEQQTVRNSKGRERAAVDSFRVRCRKIPRVEGTMIRTLAIASCAFLSLAAAQPAAAQNNTVGGALFGGALGGIVGGVATGSAGGAVAGALIGGATGALIGAEADRRGNYYRWRGGCYQAVQGGYQRIPRRYC
jgi:hypothetical protein